MTAQSIAEWSVVSNASSVADRAKKKGGCGLRKNTDRLLSYSNSTPVTVDESVTHVTARFGCILWHYVFVVFLLHFRNVHDSRPAVERDAAAYYPDDGRRRFCWHVFKQRPECTASQHFFPYSILNCLSLRSYVRLFFSEFRFQKSVLPTEGLP